MISNNRNAKNPQGGNAAKVGLPGTDKQKTTVNMKNEKEMVLTPHEIMDIVCTPLYYDVWEFSDVYEDVIRKHPKGLDEQTPLEERFHLVNFNEDELKEVREGIQMLAKMDFNFDWPPPQIISYLNSSRDNLDSNGTNTISDQYLSLARNIVKTYYITRIEMQNYCEYIGRIEHENEMIEHEKAWNRRHTKLVMLGQEVIAHELNEEELLHIISLSLAFDDWFTKKTNEEIYSMYEHTGLCKPYTKERYLLFIKLSRLYRDNNFEYQELIEVMACIEDNY